MSVDITNWRKKVRNVKAVEEMMVKEVVSWGIQELHKKTLANVSGPFYGFRSAGIPERGLLTNAGKLPVPVVYGWLRRSIKSARLTDALGVVYSDDNVAFYNRFVHDGTRYMKPRPFLKDAVDDRRPAIFNYMKYQIIKAIRSQGLK